MSDPVVGVNAWGWRPWGLPFYAGMAVHSVHDGSGRWSAPTPAERAEAERLYPNNLFIQNARRADALIDFHTFAFHMMCHDRPEPLCRLSGAYGRPEGAVVNPHALWAMGEDRP